MIFPVSTTVAAVLSVLLMTVYVVFGGAWGAGMGGIVKLVLLYVSCIAGLAAVLLLTGGWADWRKASGQLWWAQRRGPWPGSRARQTCPPGTVA